MRHDDQVDEKKKEKEKKRLSRQLTGHIKTGCKSDESTGRLEETGLEELRREPCRYEAVLRLEETVSKHEENLRREKGEKGRES